MDTYTKPLLFQLILKEFLSIEQPQCLAKLHSYLMLYFENHSSKKEKMNDRSLLKAVERVLRKQKIDQSTEMIRELVFTKILNYSEEESIIFFLFKHFEKFNALGPPFDTRVILEKMFLHGVDEAAEYVVERYTKKGYPHVALFIEDKRRAINNNDDRRL